MGLLYCVLSDDLMMSHSLHGVFFRFTGTISLYLARLSYQVGLAKRGWVVSEEPAKYTAAQDAARKRQDEKRRVAKQRISTIWLNDEEAELVDEVFQMYGGQKKKAVLDGLGLLLKKSKRKNPK